MNEQKKMSQPPSTPASPARTALAVAIVGVILGAAGVGYAVYLGLSQVPSQVSAIPAINNKATTRPILIEWALGNGTQQDRFSPPVIIIDQGDTVKLTFVSNDTGDAHTFTMALPTSGSGFFQLNNSAPGLRNFLTQALFPGGPGQSCTDQNATPYQCAITGTIGNLASTGSFTVTTPGLYYFRCFYHEKIGMFGWLVVLPNKGGT